MCYTITDSSPNFYSSSLLVTGVIRMHSEGLQIGRYRLLRLIGRGATGVVYLAQDQRIARQVALKIVHNEQISGEALAEVTRLFHHEAQTIAMLNHPNILPLFDFGDELVDGLTYTYLVTPFCEEGSLSSWLRQKNGNLLLPPRDVQSIVVQAANALDHAHDRKIVHRDVKPSNFLVRSRKDAPTRPDIMLADFGIAYISQATVQASKTIRGTPMYMAPEQWSGNPVIATDQYALAAMTYELLTGHPPFHGTQEQIMYHHLMIQPTAPSAENTRLTPAIDMVVLRALAKKPEERFPSIQDFSLAFQQAVGEPLTNPRLIMGRGTPVATPNTSSAAPLPVDEEGAPEPIPVASAHPTSVVQPATPQFKEVERIQADAIQLSSPPTPTTEAPIIEAIPGLPQSRIRWRIALPLGLIAVVLVTALTSVYVLGTKPFPSNASNNIKVSNTVTTQQNIQGTATANAATATTVAQANATATATVTNNPHDLSQKTLIQNELLTQNSAFHWDEKSGVCVFGTIGYTVSGQSTSNQVCLTRATGLGDMTIDVQMRVTQGNAGGLLLHVGNTTAYYFRASIDGYYALLLCDNTGNNCTKTLLNGFSSTITTGRNQVNALGVVIKGKSLELYINNERIDGIDDTTSSFGRFGLVAASGSKVTFSNIRVWKP